MSRSNALWMEAYENLCAEFDCKAIGESEFRRRMDARGFVISRSRQRAAS